MKDPLYEPCSYTEEQGTLLWVVLVPPWFGDGGIWLQGAGWELPI